MVKMREFENGREGKKKIEQKKMEGKKGMDLSNLKSIRNLKLFFFTNYFLNLMSLTFQWFWYTFLKLLNKLSYIRLSTLFSIFLLHINNLSLKKINNLTILIMEVLLSFLDKQLQTLLFSTLGLLTISLVFFFFLINIIPIAYDS